METKTVKINAESSNGTPKKQNPLVKRHSLDPKNIQSFESSIFKAISGDIPKIGESQSQLSVGAVKCENTQDIFSVDSFYQKSEFMQVYEVKSSSCCFSSSKVEKQQGNTSEYSV